MWAKVVDDGIKVEASKTDAGPWLPVVDERPAITTGQRLVGPTYVLATDGQSVRAIYDVETIPVNEIKNANVERDIATLRLWAGDAAVVGAQGATVSQAQIKALFTRMGVFLDRFADYVESRR